MTTPRATPTVEQMINYETYTLCQAIRDLKPSMTEEEMREELANHYKEMKQRDLGKKAQNDEGHTPFITAVRKNNIKVLNALKTFGKIKEFDIDHQDKEGKTALMHAMLVTPDVSGEVMT